VRYILIDKTRGIFLGNYLSTAMWSETLVIPITKAYSFYHLYEAKEYAKFFDDEEDFSIDVHEIDYEHKFIPIEILIKEGYSAYTYKMLKFLPAISEQIN
jgi:hypothetical protein